MVTEAEPVLRPNECVPAPLLGRGQTAHTIFAQDNCAATGVPTFRSVRPCVFGVSLADFGFYPATRALKNCALATPFRGVG